MKSEDFRFLSRIYIQCHRTGEQGHGVFCGRVQGQLSGITEQTMRTEEPEEVDLPQRHEEPFDLDTAELEGAFVQGNGAPREDNLDLEPDLDMHTDMGLDLDLDGMTLDMDQGAEEFPEAFIDKDEMVETSDDQDILCSPHSSFSYDDTLSNQEIDGLTNNNIILEYPELTLEDTQQLPFEDEMNDWFSYKDLKHLSAVLKISKSVTIDDLDLLARILASETASNGKSLECLIKLTYLSLGEFRHVKNKQEIKQNIFDNVLKIINHESLMDSIFTRLISVSFTLTDSYVLSTRVNLRKMDLLSHEFFYLLTIVNVILLSFNSEELNHYMAKVSLMDLITRKDLLIQLLKSIDRWKWISENSEINDPLAVLESMTSKVTDSEKTHLLAVTQFKIRNVLSVFNNAILFQFGNMQHIKSTKEYLNYKFETSTSTKNEKATAVPSEKGTPIIDGEIVSEGRPDALEEYDDDKGYSISSLDYNYYVSELAARYPTYTPPKYQVSDILEMTIKNGYSVPVSLLINVDSLPINQHHHLRSGILKASNGVDDVPEIHIATPMPSPTLTPQHTGNTRNYSNISEYEHTSNEIKKKLYITQSNYPNIYPSSPSSTSIAGSSNVASDASEIAPKSVKDATNIFYHHIKDDYKTKQFVSLFEEFIDTENGVNESNVSSNVKKPEHPSNYNYTEKDIKENPMFEDEIKSLQNVESFYRDGFPYFGSLITIILKLLASNIIPTQKSSESSKTRQRTAKHTDEANNKPYLSDKLTDFEKQKLEINKMKEIMLKNGSSILVLLQKWFKLSHILKFEYFTTLLFDQDFLVYLFRYLDSNKIQAQSAKDLSMKDTHSMLNNRLVYCEYQALYYLEDYNFFMKVLKLSDNEHKKYEVRDEMADFESIFQKQEDKNSETVNPLSFILPFVPHHQISAVVNPNKRCCIVIANLLKSMYYTVSHFKIQRIYKLIGIRPTEILRFYLMLHNKLFYLPILKTIKLISPFIGKKWRANNMDLVSFVYLFYKVELKDPWLNNFFNVGIEENTRRGFDNEVSLRSLIKFYNFKYYKETLISHGFGEDCTEFMNEVEKLGGDFFSKELAEYDL